MLAVILKILSILGILLLILLCVALVLLLLVLFLPIVYKAEGCYNESEKWARFRFRWFFGVLRGGYAYPEPGRFVVKLFWITLYDSGKPKVDSSGQPTANEEKETMQTSDKITEEAITETVQPQQSENNKEPEPENQQEESKQTLQEKLLAKYEKIKYTIQKIYDKIKHILENIRFYKDLFEKPAVRSLLEHVFKRVGKVLKHILPGKLKADILLGTGSPDTTGYLYGIYGMFSPYLGKNVVVNADFEQKILQGKANARGHITVFTLLINVLAVLLDKRLHLLIRKIKKHNAEMKRGD